MRPRTIGLLAALLIGAAGTGCGRPASKSRPGAPERLPRLEVVRPQRGTVERRLDLAATVEALQRVDLSARVPGVVSYLPRAVDIGRRVSKGEVLVRLAVPELEADKAYKEALLLQARKQLVQAKEALAVAQREVEETKAEEKRFQADVAYYKLRYEEARELVRGRAQAPAVEQLAARQLGSAEAALQANRAKVTTRQARVRAATADIEVAARRVEVAEKDVAKLAELIGFATVQAPFDGVITKRWVDEGATIKDPGAILLTVMYVDRVRVLVDVPQRDVPLINDDERKANVDWPSVVASAGLGWNALGPAAAAFKGDPVEVFIPALAEVFQGGKFKGTITRTGHSLDPVTRTMRAEVELDNKEGYLKPGMFGTASVLVEKRDGRLTVPAAALVRRGESQVEVYHVAETTGAGGEQRGVLRRVPVELGIDDGKVVEVKSGLTGNELIVARGNGVMRVGDAVLAVPVE
jgi:RND family efflux transporter MFP subunit